MKCSRSAFSVADLVVGLLILFMGTGVAISLIGCTRHKAHGPDMRAAMKDLATACMTADTDFNKLPPAWGAYGRPRPGTTAKVQANVFVHLLPYIQQKPLFDSGKFETAYLPEYCSWMDPSLPGDAKGHTSFVANVRVFSTYASAKQENEAIDDLTQCKGAHLSLEKIPDGAGTTILFATKYAVCGKVANLFYRAPGVHDGLKGSPFFGAGNHVGDQMPTEQIAMDMRDRLPAFQIAPSLSEKAGTACNHTPGVFGHSFGGQSMYVAMGDRSVRALSFTITGTTYARLISPGDGKPLASDW